MQQVASCPPRPGIQSGETVLVSKAAVAVRVSDVQDTLSLGVHLGNSTMGHSIAPR